MTKRLHARTPENRVRARHSAFHRGFEIEWHPDSWEFSFVDPSGERRYLGAQFSARKAIDQLLESAAPDSLSPLVDRGEIRRAIRMSDKEREAYYLASNRNMLRLFEAARRSR